ncbi:MAG: hypothetical protein CMA31_00725 [Euryarchaeota archaeon]|nr:hypothetical protein [Euryarchaeota archaeon]|tara:strand:+ start:8057 stop:8596 length:540 start_codon:yes stop_codon:yes gene_type:complete
MKRVYKDGESSEVKFFTGYEVEKTPAFDMDTLFVVGPQPLDDIIDYAEDKWIHHIYLGANQSFHVDLTQNHQGEIKLWTDIIVGLLDRNYLVTLDYDVKYHKWVLDCEFNDYEKFISQISVKLPNIDELNYNACIKIDDSDFNASNPGVWIHQVHDLMDRSKFTKWAEYEKDEPIEVDK